MGDARAFGFPGSDTAHGLGASGNKYEVSASSFLTLCGILMSSVAQKPGYGIRGALSDVIYIGVDVLVIMIALHSGPGTGTRLISFAELRCDALLRLG